MNTQGLPFPYVQETHNSRDNQSLHYNLLSEKKKNQRKKKANYFYAIVCFCYKRIKTYIDYRHRFFYARTENFKIKVQYMTVGKPHGPNAKQNKLNKKQNKLNKNALAY